jgi:hypothetical protein
LQCSGSLCWSPNFPFERPKSNKLQLAYSPNVCATIMLSIIFSLNLCSNDRKSSTKRAKLEILARFYFNLLIFTFLPSFFPLSLSSISVLPNNWAKTPWHTSASSSRSSRLMSPLRSQSAKKRPFLVYGIARPTASPTGRAYRTRNTAITSPCL